MKKVILPGVLATVLTFSACREKPAEKGPASNDVNTYYDNTVRDTLPNQDNTNYSDSAHKDSSVHK